MSAPHLCPELSESPIPEPHRDTTIALSAHVHINGNIYIIENSLIILESVT